MQYTVHELKNARKDVTFQMVDNGDQMVVPTFEISDGKIFGRRKPEGFTYGTPITLSDIRREAQGILGVSPNSDIHVVLFEDSPHLIGVFGAQNPVALALMG